jgi:hypothetical protein
MPPDIVDTPSANSSPITCGRLHQKLLATACEVLSQYENLTHYTIVGQVHRKRFPSVDARTLLTGVQIDARQVGASSLILHNTIL